MITAKRLKELLEKIPDDAKCYAYEGESSGIVLYLEGQKGWFIGANESHEDETYTEGFKGSPHKA